MKTNCMLRANLLSLIKGTTTDNSTDSCAKTSSAMVNNTQAKCDTSCGP